MTQPLIAVDHVDMCFPLSEGKGQFVALRDVNLSINEGEIVALLGRSGSGKSTLLRIMAGLIAPSDGKVEASGSQLTGCNADTTMVFQSFALLPWLTVLDNVALGLEARGDSRADRTRSALGAIGLVGLEGFESAYPRELSGGMKQRVGLARALVMRPKVLFMDEPFSALDVLTADNLRGEIDSLWNSHDFPAQSVLLVTHNIEEAVMLADRVLVLGGNPGHVRGEIPIDLKRPHDRNDPRFAALVQHLYTIMTNPEMSVSAVPSSPLLPPGVAPAASKSPYAMRLPHARIGGVGGLLELLARNDDDTEVSRLAERLGTSIDDLLTILDCAVLLDFASVVGGKVSLTPVGRQYAAATIVPSKEIFRRQLVGRVPVFSSIVRTLRENNGTMRAEFFKDLWDEYFPPVDVERQFDSVVSWGRYADLFQYDAHDGMLHLV
jgi:NitT/TauT family transport system ATP-binding protein